MSGDCITLPPLAGPLWSERDEAEHQWTIARVATEDAAERAHQRAIIAATSVEVHGPLTREESRRTVLEALDAMLAARWRCEDASWRYLLREPARRVVAPAGLYAALAWAREVERRVRRREGGVA
jgi:hypothetical protein